MAGRLFPAGGGPSILLSKPVMAIGRAEGCDIKLADAVVSNVHCVLMFDGTYWLVEDKTSRNGTMVNGIRVPSSKAIVLRSGDTLIISKKFRLVIEYSTSAERQRFADLDSSDEAPALGDDRNYGEHGPATKRLEPHDKDVWSRFED
jgi:pSer/pThr/pTyr-binding forkhead associated (FHA) protein